MIQLVVLRAGSISRLGWSCLCGAEWFTCVISMLMFVISFCCLVIVSIVLPLQNHCEWNFFVCLMLSSFTRLWIAIWSILIGIHLIICVFVSFTKHQILFALICRLFVPILWAVIFAFMVYTIPGSWAIGRVTKSSQTLRHPLKHTYDTLWHPPAAHLRPPLLHALVGCAFMWSRSNYTSFFFFFSWSHFSCDAGAVVFIVFNYIISFITNGNTRDH